MRCAVCRCLRGGLKVGPNYSAEWGQITLPNSLLGCVLSRLATAQTPEPFSTKNLSCHSQLVLERLAALKSLSSPNWKVHVDDLPLGEDIALDDSKWIK